MFYRKKSDLDLIFHFNMWCVLFNIINMSNSHTTYRGIRNLLQEIVYSRSFLLYFMVKFFSDNILVCAQVLKYQYQCYDVTVNTQYRNTAISKAVLICNSKYAISLTIQ